MAKDKGPTEADIIQQRINIALAKSQRLVASWLPPDTRDASSSTPGTADDASFIQSHPPRYFSPPHLQLPPLPEAQHLTRPLFLSLRLGLGATPIGAGSALTRANPRAQIKKLMLGRTDLSSASSFERHRPKPERVKGSVSKGEAGSLSEDEQGRSGLVGGRPKRKRKLGGGTVEDQTPGEDGVMMAEGDAVGEVGLVPPGVATGVSREKRSKRTNYLDEVLAERAAKKKRRKKQQAAAS